MAAVDHLPDFAFDTLPGHQSVCVEQAFKPVVADARKT